jgi:hypothetical protein
MASGMIERFHRVLHDSMSHYVNCTGTSWDIVLPFFLMAYRGTPHSTTKYSPFFLLHGREMNLPTTSDLKAKLSPEKPQAEYGNKLENLRSNLRKAYEELRKDNRNVH